MPRDKIGISPSRASKPGSEYQLLYGALTEAYHKQHRSNITSWNSPRRTKAVDSLGRIEENIGFRSPKSKNKNTRKTYKSKCRRRYLEKLERYKRLEELARPKILVGKLPQEAPNPFKVKKCALKYQPTLTIASLAKPKERDQVKERLSKVRHSALQYRLTEHTARLAEPKIRYDTYTRLPGRVAETALFARAASKRVNELATPRNVIRPSSVKDPYTISPAALQVVCSPRIDKLAKPKKPRTPYTRTDSSSSDSKRPRAVTPVTPLLESSIPDTPTVTGRRHRSGVVVPYIVTEKNLEDYYEHN